MNGLRIRYPLMALALLSLLAATWGGLLNAVAVLLFLVSTVRAVWQSITTHKEKAA